MSQFINFNTVIGNGKSYLVPIYQRDYSWEKDDWEDLWSDIEEIPNDKQHYLGYLVLQPIEEKNQSYWIIDGQQRITTLSLLSLAVIKLLQYWAESGIEPEANRIRSEKEVERYVGNFSTSRLTIDPKLKLNRNNNDFYQSYLLNLRRPQAVSKLKRSQQLLQKAFDYFYEKLTIKFEENQSGATLSEFLENIVGNGLIFTVIEVQNDLDAFKVFETLNARGVKLSTADLLKNYLFSQTAKLGQIDLDEAERRWQNIADTLKTNDLTTFIRHYWNSKNYPIVRQNTLFKSIKKSVASAEDAFVLLQNLENNVVFYTAFSSPYDEIWEKEERKHLRVLQLLEVTTCYSLMLAALEFLPRGDFKILLRELAAITFRYNLSGLNPNEAERIFGKVAVDISSKRLANVRDVVLSLKPLYVPDDNFEQSFTTISINSKRKKNLIKYILVKMENQLVGNDSHQSEDASSSIEHILPENPGSVWETNFPNEEQSEYIYRIGNYTLLETSINHKLGNEIPFTEKLTEYRISKYIMTKDHLEYVEWSPETLYQHQQKMARWAKGIWKSNFIF